MQCLVQFICMICTYIYIDIYIKWHPKTAFLFATHAVILTLPHFTFVSTLLSMYIYYFLFTFSFFFVSVSIKRVFEDKRFLIFFL